jgi:serine/threonine-protein kinase
MLKSLESEWKKELFPGDTAQYLPTGHIVYAVDNNLYSIAFELNKLSVTGGPIPMVVGVLRAAGAPQYAVSDSGTLAYIPEGAAAEGNTLLWVERDGKEVSLSAPPDSYTNPRVSPDGTKVALAFTSGGEFDIWIWDLIRETMTPLATFEEASDRLPLWTQDGKRIVFTSTREGGFSLYWKAADGTGEIETLGSVRDSNIFPWSWSSGENSLVVMQQTGVQNTGFDIGIMSMEGEHEYVRLLQENHNEGQPKVSPDGNWIAYTSDESGQVEVYIRPFPDVNKGREKASTSGGHSPLWSPDSKTVFYRDGDAVMEVSVKVEPNLSLDAPRTLFQKKYITTSFPNSSDYNTWDIHPDGKRFLMMKPNEIADSDSTAEARPQINVVLNWFEELKDRVPVD